MLSVPGACRIAATAVAALLLFARPAGAAAPDPPVVDDLAATVTTVLDAPGRLSNSHQASAVPAQRAAVNACTYRYDPTGMAADNFDFSRPDGPSARQLARGEIRWYSVSCPGQAEYPVFTTVGRQAPGPPPPAPGELAVVARRVLQLPFPSVQYNPPDASLVNLATWLWLSGDSWQVRSSSLTLRGTSVTVFAKPVRVAWVMGDGAVLTCHGPGVAYDPRAPAEAQSTYCSHTYRCSSAHEPHDAYAGTATAVWDVRWVGSLPGGATEDGALPALELTSPFELRVREVQDLVTSTT